MGSERIEYSRDGWHPGWGSGVTRLAVTSALCAGLFAAACGRQPAQDANGDPGLDAGVTSDSTAVPDTPPGRELTIETYRRFVVAGETENAPFVVVQDGDGAWASVTGVNGVYHVTLAHERYGVAAGCKTSRRSQGVLSQRTVADGLLLQFTGCQVGPPPGAVKLTVVANHVPAGSVVGVQTRGSSVEVDSENGTALVELNESPGLTELFATLLDDHDAAFKVIRVGPIDLRSDQTMTLDFETQGASFEEQPVTVTPDLGRPANVSTAVLTQTGEFALGGERSGTTYPVLPAELRRPGDRYDVVAGVSDPAAVRISTIATSTPNALPFVLAPLVTGASTTVLAGPSPRPQWSFITVVPELANQVYFMSATTGGRGIVRWDVFIRRSWLAGLTSVRYTLPDFSALPEVGSDFDLANRARVSWQIGRDEFTDPTASGEGEERSTSVGGNAGELRRRRHSAAGDVRSSQRDQLQS